MTAAADGNNTNETPRARRRPRGKLLRRILIKVGLGLLIHEGVEGLGEIFDDVSDIVGDTLEELEEDTSDAVENVEITEES